MRRILPILVLCFGLVGCIVETGETVTRDAQGNLVTNKTYKADPRIAATTQTLEGINRATAPINPYYQTVELVLKIGGGILLGGSTLFAAWKGKQKIHGILKKSEKT